MPKIGAKPEDAERPYELRCAHCGHPVEKAVSRFKLNGSAAAHAYLCKQGCGSGCTYRATGSTAVEFCTPQRVYTDGEHLHDDGAGGTWTHPGPRDACPLPDCQPLDSRGDVPVGGLDELALQREKRRRRELLA